MIKKQIYYINYIKRLTLKIFKLNEHLKNNKKDYNTVRSLLKKVTLRKKQLKYLKNKDYNFYNIIKKKFKIRKL
ncbi:MAG: 30S ribosomal protein S15 [Candidatus Shikimatogenerans bostrichidophilus]|nr:MAG: 30S ribosomal protein S15 [Candidatus Shikimatogenerans bostrichidophilus]